MPDMEDFWKAAMTSFGGLPACLRHFLRFTTTRVIPQTAVAHLLCIGEHLPRKSSNIARFAQSCCKREVGPILDFLAGDDEYRSEESLPTFENQACQSLRNGKASRGHYRPSRSRSPRKLSSSGIANILSTVLSISYSTRRNSILGYSSIT